MDAQQIKVFIDAMAASDLSEFEATKDGWTLRLVRGVARTSVPLPPPGSMADARALEPAKAGEQCATLSGIVFLQPAPDAPPFVKIGDAVKQGQTLCVIEAMKIFNEVPAERDGIVEAILVNSGQEVDAGQPLVQLR